jgi:hypothetical protein
MSVARVGPPHLRTNRTSANLLRTHRPRDPGSIFKARSTSISLSPSPRERLARWPCRAALVVWPTRPVTGPGLLPILVAVCIQPRRPRDTTGRPFLFRAPATGRPARVTRRQRVSILDWLHEEFFDLLFGLDEPDHQELACFAREHGASEE